MSISTSSQLTQHTCVCAVQVCGSARGGSVGGDRGVACDWAEAPMVWLVVRAWKEGPR